MAKGRRDYTWGVLQDSILPGKYSVNFADYDFVLLTAYQNKVVYTYTVPDGYRLYLTGLCVSSVSPGPHTLQLWRNSDVLLTLFFSLTHAQDFGSFGSLSFEGGEVLNVNCENYESISAYFWVEVFGVLEQLV